MEFLKKLVGYFLNGILTSIFDGIFSGPTPGTNVKEQKTEAKTDQTDQTAKLTLNITKPSEFSNANWRNGGSLFPGIKADNLFPQQPQLPLKFTKDFEYNFYTTLGPINPAFIDATLSCQDIAYGFRLEYNPNGVLWRVNAAGIPHPDDLDNFFEQSRVIEGANNKTMEKSKPFSDVLQAINSSNNSVIANQSKIAKEINAESLRENITGTVIKKPNVIQSSNNSIISKEGIITIKIDGQSFSKKFTVDLDQLTFGNSLQPLELEKGTTNNGLIQNVSNSVKQTIKDAITKGTLPNPATMQCDYRYFEVGVGIGELVGIEAGYMIDKKGNVYAIIDASFGFGLAPFVRTTAGQGYFGNANKSTEQQYERALTGLSFGSTTGAGLQGNVSISTSGVISGEFLLAPSIGKTFGGRYAFYLFNINN